MTNVPIRTHIALPHRTSLPFLLAILVKEEKKTRWYNLTKVIKEKRRRDLADIQRELAQNGEIINEQMVVTKTENKFGQALIDAGFEIVPQYTIDGRSFDFKLFHYPILIEVDGSIHATLEKRQSDYRKDRYVQRRGYRVLRFTNDEIHDKEQLPRLIIEVRSMVYRVGNLPREIHIYPLSLWEQIQVWLFKKKYNYTVTPKEVKEEPEDKE